MMCVQCALCVCVQAEARRRNTAKNASKSPPSSAIDWNVARQSTRAVYESVTIKHPQKMAACRCFPPQVTWSPPPDMWVRH